jgi:chemotaxis protein CheC
MINNEITNFDLDILGEIGNIGAGNAATALSQILNQTVLIEVPHVELCALESISNTLGGAEAVRTGIFFSIEGDLNGYVAFILDDTYGQKIFDLVTQGYGNDIEIDGVLTEVGNIISGAYINAIASMIDGRINLSPPGIGHDMIGALIDEVASHIYSLAEKTVVITTTLTIGGDIIPSYYTLLLEKESLSKLLGIFNRQES